MHAMTRVGDVDDASTAGPEVGSIACYRNKRYYYTALI
jgi:hypothetical protein